jgi:hypothetical protein
MRWPLSIERGCGSDRPARIFFLQQYGLLAGILLLNRSYKDFMILGRNKFVAIAKSLLA